MEPVKVRLARSWDESHTWLTLRLSLPKPLQAWELKDLCAAIRAWTGRRTRVVLPAEAPCEWLDEWAGVLEDALAGDVEVEFALSRRDGTRR